MALSPTPPNTTGSFVALLLVLIANLPEISGQPPTFSSTPTITDCGARLLLLSPCAPFVQGSVPAPTQQCCDNLAQIYSQEPVCLCLFLNGIALRSLPFNASLALDLPGICSPQMSPSICSAQPPPTAPAANPIFSGANSSSSPIAVPATPMITVTPIPNTLLGFGQNAGHRLIGGYLILMLAFTTFLFTMEEYY